MRFCLPYFYSIDTKEIFGAAHRPLCRHAFRERRIDMKRMRYTNKRQARILVVDNEQMIALALSAILQKQGYAVATAFSGEQAIAIAADFIPDLLVSEIYMGAMNGVESATQITGKLPNCSVLFLSGFASISDVLKIAPKRLVYSFMSKPMHPLDLLNAIAYKLSVVSTDDGPAVIAVGCETIRRDAVEKMPTKAGFILRKAGTWAPEATQGRPDVVFFDMRLHDAAGFEMRPQ
jgi:CheY-like chemotaxis protein